MNTWLLIDIAALAGVVVLTGIMIPQILLIAFRKSLFDIPNERKIHKLPVPRLGGIAFMPAIFFTMLLVFGIGMTTEASWLAEGISDESITQALFLGCSLMALYIVGLADDLIGVRYSAKFAVQVLTAVLLIAGGLTLSNLHGLLGLHTLPYPVAVALTALVIVFITNAINLIDGIDGLASGLSAIACLIYGYIALHCGLYLFSLLAFCSLGALVSFFSFNVFGNVQKHKKIFMGDTGALTIGIILSALSLKLCSHSDADETINFAVAAFSPLLIPCLDVVRVYLHRVRHHRNPFLPDKNHIHHKLLAAGLRQRAAMITIVSFSALLSLANIMLSPMVNITILFLADILLWIVLNIALSRRIAQVAPPEAGK